jgi:hypothetical protein
MQKDTEEFALEVEQAKKLHGNARKLNYYGCLDRWHKCDTHPKINERNFRNSQMDLGRTEETMKVMDTLRAFDANDIRLNIPYDERAHPTKTNIERKGVYPNIPMAPTPHGHFDAVGRWCPRPTNRVSSITATKSETIAANGTVTRTESLTQNYATSSAAQESQWQHYPSEAAARRSSDEHTRRYAGWFANDEEMDERKARAKDERHDRRRWQGKDWRGSDDGWSNP